MTSVLQLSGTLQSQTTTGGGGNTGGGSEEILTYGNPTSYSQNITTSGSQCIGSEITIKGLNSNVNNTAVLNIQFPTGVVGSNWSCDLQIRAYSDTSITTSNWTIMKPGSDSASWTIINGQATFTNQTNLLMPTITTNSTTRVLTIQQAASSTNDGSVYYSVMFTFSSGNNPNIAVPIFFL
jgi:hypothetical protein